MRKIIAGWFKLFCLAGLLAGCIAASQTPGSPSATHPAGTAAASPAAPTLSPQITATPGVILWGSVRLADGSGLAGAAICRSYASYPGVLIATTDAQGRFQTGLAYIPGDEMIAVWPYRSGYVFEPEQVNWRHYHGLEISRLEFIARPGKAAGASPGDCR